jgi:hypothetical protein
VLPDSVAGVSDEQLTKIRRALMATYADEAVAAARKRLADLKERTRFVKGRNEAEDLRLEFETARDAMVKATLEAAQKFDPSIEKDPLVLTLNAIEEQVKKRGQENAKAAQAKASEAERAAAKEGKGDKPDEKPAAEAKAEAPKAMTPAELLADVEGVSAEDMKKFRLAALKARRDPKVRDQGQAACRLRKEAEFLSQEEKTCAGNSKPSSRRSARRRNPPSPRPRHPSPRKPSSPFSMRSKSAREAAAKAGPKKATKTPLKPFPFGRRIVQRGLS